MTSSTKKHNATIAATDDDEYAGNHEEDFDNDETESASADDEEAGESSEFIDTKNKSIANKKAECSHCSKLVDLRGLRIHEKSCRDKSRLLPAVADSVEVAPKKIKCKVCHKEYHPRWYQRHLNSGCGGDDEAGEGQGNNDNDDKDRPKTYTLRNGYIVTDDEGDDDDSAYEGYETGAEKKRKRSSKLASLAAVAPEGSRAVVAPEGSRPVVAPERSRPVGVPEGSRAVGVLEESPRDRYKRHKTAADDMLHKIVESHKEMQKCATSLDIQAFEKREQAQRLFVEASEDEKVAAEIRWDLRLSKAAKWASVLEAYSRESRPGRVSSSRQEPTPQAKLRAQVERVGELLRLEDPCGITLFDSSETTVVVAPPPIASAAPVVAQPQVAQQQETQVKAQQVVQAIEPKDNTHEPAAVVAEPPIVSALPSVVQPSVASDVRPRATFKFSVVEPVVINHGLKGESHQQAFERQLCESMEKMGNWRDTKYHKSVV